MNILKESPPHEELVKVKGTSERGTRLSGVQIFRGLAALTVLLYHINLQFSAFVPGAPDFKAEQYQWIVHRLGFLGVDFFFVLSGFIIHHVHYHDLGLPNRGKLFLAKRFIRVQPLLWVIIVLKQCYLSFVNGESVEWVTIFNTAFTLPGEKLIGVAWTLTFEWMFYVFFLVGIIAGKRWFWVGCLVWSTLVIMIAPFDRLGWSAWLMVITSPYIIQFLSGVVAAELFKRCGDLTPKIRHWPGWAALVFMLIGVSNTPMNLTPREWSSTMDMAIGRFYWGLVFGLVVWWAATNDSLFRKSWMLGLIVVGNASYAIYLFHNEMLQGLIRVGHHLGIFDYELVEVWMWVFTAVLVVSGVVIHFIVEKPLLNIGRQLIRVWSQTISKS